jgi:hypothetical protein
LVWLVDTVALVKSVNNLELGINDFVQKSRCTYPDQTLKQLLTSRLIRSLLIAYIVHAKIPMGKVVK